MGRTSRRIQTEFIYLDNVIINRMIIGCIYVIVVMFWQVIGFRFLVFVTLCRYGHTQKRGMRGGKRNQSSYICHVSLSNKKQSSFLNTRIIYVIILVPACLSNTKTTQNNCRKRERNKNSKKTHMSASKNEVNCPRLNVELNFKWKVKCFC